MTARNARETIQRALEVTIDGVFSPKTRAALIKAPEDARKFTQRMLAIPEPQVDGIIGPKTLAAFDALKKAPAESEWPAVPVAPPPAGDEFDERTEKNLATLNAKSQAVFRPFMTALRAHFAAKGVVAKIISGSRTVAEQNALYAKGRTAPGPIVTNAKGAASNHVGGCAADIGLFVGGDYLEDSPMYKEIGPIARAHGLQWGGDWTSFKDLPHVEAKQFREVR